MKIAYQLSFPIMGLLLICCSGRHSVTANRKLPDSTKISENPSLGDTDEVGYPTKYIEQLRLDEPDQVIALVNRHAVVNGEVDYQSKYGASSSYFVYLDKKTGKTDTIEAKFDNDLDGSELCYIRDMTDSFQVAIPIVQVVTPGLDIDTYNTFITYGDGKLKILFQLINTRTEGIRLRREGRKLVGFVSGRDDVVDNVEENYPVEIDTKTFDVNYPELEKQFINWETTTKQSFRAHRVKDGQVDSSLVTVKAGAEVRVDTLYRLKGKVRLIISDSVTVEVKVETAKEKLEHNHAG
jgi:hypothetical protein